MRVLLVDDHAGIPRALSRCFKGDGWEPITALSVDEAYSIIPYVDVVVTDYEMPNGGGESVVKSCNEYNVPCVVLTGNESVEYKYTVLKPSQYSLILKAVNLAMKGGL